jgi:hypothetical protein
MKVSECQKNGETRWMVIYRDPAKAGQVYPYTRAFFKTRRAAEVFVQGQTADAAGLLATWEEFGIHERLDAIRALKRSIAGGYPLSQACDLAESRGGTAISFDELMRRSVKALRNLGGGWCLNHSKNVDGHSLRVRNTLSARGDCNHF